MLTTEINDIRSLVTSGSFSGATESSVLTNLSPSNIQEMLDFASAN
jgi:hypothetical protein